MREKLAIALLCVALTGCTTVHDYVYGPPKVFIVFFPVKSADFTPDAADIVKAAAVQIQKQHPAAVQIAAGVAPGGNMEMSTPRFVAVRKLLVDDGVPEGHDRAFGDRRSKTRHRARASARGNPFAR
ncbi:MAG: hypothetical protein WDM89_20320 [Rhizomicrobium sp.]